MNVLCSICIQQNGDQAIHCAASAGHLQIVKTLIDEYGVLPTAMNNVSSSAIHDVSIANITFM